MSGPNPMLTKSFGASGAIPKHRIVAFGASDVLVALAASAAAAAIGVSTDLAAEDGQRVDVHVAGLAEVEFGGTVVRGSPVTADASGKAVAAAYDGSSRVHIIGFAMASAANGEIAPILIAPGRLDPGKVLVPFSINQTDLLAGTSQFVVSPAAGNITKMVTTVQVAVGTGGGLTLELANVVVDGLSVVIADGAAVGDIDSDTPSAPDHATTVVAKDQAIEIVPAAAFATSGAVNGYIEITL